MWSYAGERPPLRCEFMELILRFEEERWSFLWEFLEVFDFRDFVDWIDFTELRRGLGSYFYFEVVIGFD